jgi:ATP-dependent helicase HrpB
VESVLDEVKTALAEASCAVLQAPPGAGKTTRIPPALMKAPWLSGRRIVMLEPRRLAARAAAFRMASGFGEPVGNTVGYRIRMDSKVGANTRIEVVTEGILTRMIQADPLLSGVGLVIFDEFHERHLTSDLGLVLCLDLQEAFRPDLRLLVMSATLDAAKTSELLGAAPVISCSGRLFPVDTRYRAVSRDGPDDRSVAEAVVSASRTEKGGILVFLPGAPEIRRVAARLSRASLEDPWEVYPLYGELGREGQERAILPAGPGRRKIVLATNIAETSLTIEGIGVVVDSGWVRVPRFDPRTGMTRLVTLPVSRDSADQRRGRAGRTGPGVCIRLWPEVLHPSLPSHRTPEILEADLAPLALELALWGLSDPGKLAWLDPPPEGKFRQAQWLLQELGAVDKEGRITGEGRTMAGLGIHPRLGRMVLEGRREGLGKTAFLLAAILEDRDFLSFQAGSRESDVRLRLDILTAISAGRAIPPGTAAVNQVRCRRILKWAERLGCRLGGKPGRLRPQRAGRLLACAYPDRIAMARAGQLGRFVLSGGGGAQLPSIEPMSTEPFLVAAELDGNKTDAKIFLAAVYDRQTLEDQFQSRIKTEETVQWDPGSRSVSGLRKKTYGALVLAVEKIAAPEPAKVRKAMLDGIRSLGIESLPWNEELCKWRRRVMFLRRVFPGQRWPELSETILLSRLDSWLGPVLDGVARLGDLDAVTLKNALFGLCSWKQHQVLDQLAPGHLTVPSGNRRELDYAGEIPVLPVKLQEMFGCNKHPSVAGGSVPVLLHLLSPAGRPVQVTRDLESFWRQGYESVKRELKGRYPKHPWPEDPLSAAPTAEVKRRA